MLIPNILFFQVEDASWHEDSLSVPEAYPKAANMPGVNGSLVRDVDQDLRLGRSSSSEGPRVTAWGAIWLYGLLTMQYIP